MTNKNSQSTAFASGDADGIRPVSDTVKVEVVQKLIELSSNALGALASEQAASDLSPALQVETRKSIDGTDFILASEAETAQNNLVKAGRYDLGNEVAHGGVGLVLKGYDRAFGRQIAFKVLLDIHRHNEEIQRLLIDEAIITSRLQHPGIIPIYDFGELADETPFFTMSLVNGKTLEQLLRARSNPEQELPRFLKIFEQICQTIAYAHSQGVIHCDLKPGNVMVADFGVVKVMDWGIAKLLNEPDAVATDPADATALTTRLGKPMGTPAYMSPEQTSGEANRLDRRVDVFGLGAVLCEVLTGQPPYLGDDLYDIFQKASAGNLENVFDRLDACQADRELIALAKRCLAAEPSERPVDGGEVALAFTAYLESNIKRAEKDLVRFFELSMDLFCIAGLDGYFHRVNSNFSKVLGYSDKELVSRPFLDFVHPDDREITIAEVARLSLGLPVVCFRNRYRKIDGSYRWFEWTAKSIPSEGIILAAARDITDQIS